MDLDGKVLRMTKGPSDIEKRDMMVSQIERLIGPYQKNVAPLTSKDKGPDREGYIHDAVQALRVLNTLKKPGIEPDRWPKGFEIPDHIQFVLIDAEGSPFSRKISHTDFATPAKFVNAIEEFLTVGQIEGL